MHSSALKQNVECLRVCCSAYCAGEEMNANPLSCTVNQSTYTVQHQPVFAEDR